MAQDRAEYEQNVRQAVSSGQLLTAIEVARDGLLRFPDSVMLRQQLALALAQTGALEAAQSVLVELLRESAKDEETLSLLGRIYKELWRRAPAPAEAAEALRKSCKYYGDAFALKESYYPGINLAFTLLAAGQRDEAAEIATKVAKQCRRELAAAGAKASGWLLGTLGEALIHLGQLDEAAGFYRQAAAAFKGRWRDLASMQRQAREIVGFLKEEAAGTKVRWSDLASIQRRAREFLGRAKRPDRDWLDRCFDFPTVVVFAGHMIDGPNRAVPRFPPEREGAVRDAIRQQLEKIQAGMGYSSAACGADLLFCEAMLDRDAKVNLVLPSPVDAFKRQSVSFAGPEWERRFHHVLGSATSTLFANASEAAPSDIDPATSQALVYSNRIVLGLSLLQARALDLDLHAIAVWDGKPGDAPGGTASNVAEWRHHGLEPHIIPPLGGTPAPAPAGGAAGGAARPPADAGQAVRQEIKAVLYAEIINYRKITEAQMPAYIREFKGLVATLVGRMQSAPAVAETWGGGHHFIYDSLQDAALFAIELRDLVVKTPWAERGLPGDLGVKLALHAGPVFAFNDPLSGRQTCIGAHVTRTSRISPVTPAGQIYASQEFAALCGTEDRAANLGFEFLGRVATTKLFDDAPLYRLDRLA